MRSRKHASNLVLFFFFFCQFFCLFCFFIALLLSLFLVLLQSFWSIVSFGNYECEIEVKLQAQQSASDLRFKRGIFKPFSLYRKYSCNFNPIVARFIFQFSYNYNFVITVQVWYGTRRLELDQDPFCIIIRAFYIYQRLVDVQSG